MVEEKEIHLLRREVREDMVKKTKQPIMQAKRSIGLLRASGSTPKRWKDRVRNEAFRNNMFGQGPRDGRL